ncbi:deoxyuridine 5'-triphosphate nucleotidohydrolase [Propionigenium maris DSM 9537]|uniref:Deoxyuridine 5'-triphosphate nucleotidohydrolase n=1 Tax=Propionigenium maris DSM 9537 TaxID=1123000 RepID=A0A9W6GKS6_9FUSO|nr:dUTP diphosphatase [Propionigenium maris]GLI55566.1 deoxyuridine 5'-triphosphate nucleotidohydrolase [Propionigenium maris DSM 9537]
MERVDVKVVREDGVKLPVYMTEGAAGMDVYAHIEEGVTLGSLERAMVPTGIKMEIPFGYEVQVRPRSGLAAKHGISLVNTPGTIDSDYRGEVKIILINLSRDEYTIEPGERIGQLVLQKVYKMNFVECDELTETVRDAGGFGHTGK